MSKTNKVVGCKHIFTQGTKKGEKCGKNCRGDYCCNHKSKKLEYLQNYYTDHKEEIKAKANKQSVKININAILEKECKKYRELDKEIRKFLDERKELLDDKFRLFY